MISFLTGVRWFLIVVLICISLIISVVEHLFVCLLAICMPSLQKCLFRISARFWIEFFDFCYRVAWVVCIFCKLSPFSHIICKYFLLFCRLSFHFVYISFVMQKILSLSRSHFFVSVAMGWLLGLLATVKCIALGDWPKKTLVWFMSENVLPMCSFRSFMVSSPVFKSSRYFQFIFVCGVRMCANFFDLHVAIQLSQYH